MDVPELYYYANNMAAMGNFGSIDSVALKRVHEACWVEFEPHTKISAGDYEIDTETLKDSLMHIIDLVVNSRDALDLSVKVQDFFEEAMKGGYKNFQDMIADIGCIDFSIDDLRDMFFKFIHPDLKKTMPIELKPTELNYRLDDSGMPKEFTLPMQCPRGVGRKHQL